jgi:hypothetical protein
MMMKARENKASITRYARAHPEVVDIIPTDDEWEVCKMMERVLLPFYDFTRLVSKDQPCLSDSIGIMRRLDDLLDDVSKADGAFGDVGDDIRKAFLAGVAKVDEYTALINDNITYHTAAVLDPRIKCTLIREQYGDGADDITKRIREYLKKEALKSDAPFERSTDILVLYNANQHQLGLLRRARKSNLATLCGIDRYLDSEAIDWDDTPLEYIEPPLCKNTPRNARE